MKTIPFTESAIANPALKPFEILIGEWETEGTHPLVPGTIFHGRTSFQWLEGGAYLIMHSEIKEKEIPSGISILGSDDATQQLFMLYFDERGVSRKYDVSISGMEMKWWRDSDSFSQRCTFVISADGKTIVSNGEMSKDNKTWEGDLSLTYRLLSRA